MSIGAARHASNDQGGSLPVQASERFDAPGSADRRVRTMAEAALMRYRDRY
jgi:hypothetical protein